MTNTHSNRALLILPALLLLGGIGCEEAEYEAQTQTPTYDPSSVTPTESATEDSGNVEGSTIPAEAQLQPAENALNYGLVIPGDMAVKSLVFTNRSDAPVIVESAYILGNPVFSLLDPIDSSVVVEAGESIAFAIAFSPDWDLEATGQLYIASEGNPDIKVALTGSCHSPLAEVLPGRLDFDGTLIDCPVTESVLIHNAGHEDLIIEDLWMEGLENPEFEFVSSLTFPKVVAPGGRVSVDVIYTPNGTGGDSATVFVLSNDPQLSERPVPVQGYGRYPTDMEQVFEAGTKRPVDVLLVVDNSGSMCGEQEVLAENLQTFLEIIDAEGVPYHIGVVDVEDTVLEGEPVFITPETPDRYDTFFDNAFVGCDGAQGVEMGLAIGTKTLFRQKYGLNQNTGFYRQDAALRVLYISDEEDQSPLPVEAYIEAMYQLKDNRDDVVLSAIAGAPSTGCNAGTVSATKGDRYQRAATLTGGAFESICNPDFSDVVTDMAWDSVIEFREAFPLTYRPDPGTIAVTIDGVAVPNHELNGWSYDDRAQSIRLTGTAIPEDLGAEVKINYTESSTCRADLESELED